MKKVFLTLAVVTLIVGITGVANVYALPWQDADSMTDLVNITVFDGMETPDHTGIGIGREDNETEPGAPESQDWDLEAFYLENSLLTMVGGFEFMYGRTGYPMSMGVYEPGDLFIDLSGDGSYEYAVHFFPVPGTDDVTWRFAPGGVYASDYEVYQIDSTTVLDSPSDIGGSSPWRVNPGSRNIVGTGTATYWYKLTDADISDALEGDWFPPGADYVSPPLHNALQIDLAAILGSYTPMSGTIFHYTMSSGFDDLIGYDPTTPIPEPGTLLLLGAGLIGLLAFRRKRFNK